MVLEEINRLAMQIIAHSGDSKSNSLEAVENAVNGCFDEAEKLLSKAEKELTLAHEVHTQVLVIEASDPQNFKFSFLLVHASNHMSAAEISRDYAKGIIGLCRMIKEGDKKC